MVEGLIIRDPGEDRGRCNDVRLGDAGTWVEVITKNVSSLPLFGLEELDLLLSD